MFGTGCSSRLGLLAGGPLRRKPMAFGTEALTASLYHPFPRNIGRSSWEFSISDAEPTEKAA